MNDRIPTKTDSAVPLTDEPANLLDAIGWLDEQAAYVLPVEIKKCTDEHERLEIELIKFIGEISRDPRNILETPIPKATIKSSPRSRPLPLSLRKSMTSNGGFASRRPGLSTKGVC